MQVHLATICTNRKRPTVRPDLDIRNFDPSPQDELLNEWVENVGRCEDRYAAKRVYCGRGFQQALHTGAYLGRDPLIISAGLGLVHSTDSIPAYNATLAGSSVSGIRARSVGAFNESQWWIDLNEQMPNGRLLSDFVRRRPKCLMLITLSAGYARLVSDDLNMLSDSAVNRIRIIGLASDANLPERLRHCVMPYDTRFDGPDSPCPGTRSDFPQRATRHFAENILRSSPRGGVKRHATLVSELMDSMRHPKSITRVRLSDDEIMSEIANSWDAVAGSSSRMLRLFRDKKKIACEQKRFSQLFNQVKLTRTLK